LEGIVKTSRLYDSTIAALRQHLPSVPDSQHESLALVIVGITRSQSGHLGKIARNLPLPTRQDSKEQRVRRLISNPRISQKTHYQPIVRQAIAGLVRQPIHLVLDRVLLHDRHNLLLVGLACRRRVIPLVWQLVPNLGSSSLSEHQAILREALALLPETRRVTVHADSEFRSQELFAWLVEQGCEAFLGLRGGLRMSQTPQGLLVPIQEQVAPEQGKLYFNQVYVSAERLGPVNLYAWWSKDDRGQPILRAVQTSRPATPHSYRVGKRRMWIEPTFREWERGGFGLSTSGLVVGERLVRLLIPVMLVYVWMLHLGRWVTQRGWRSLVDGGRPRARTGQWGLFQRGVAWLQRQLSLELPPPPVVFYLSP
jgi:hypothetical protein